MGQSNDLVSLFFGEVIIDVVDNSLTSLWCLAPLVVLVRKSAMFSAGSHPLRPIHGVHGNKLNFTFSLGSTQV